MNRAPRTATSMMVLPTRSSTIVKPAARLEEGGLGVLTAFAPSSRDDRRDHGPRPVSDRVREKHGRARNADFLGGEDVDADLERVGRGREYGDPTKIVRPVPVEIDDLVPLLQGCSGVHFQLIQAEAEQA